MDGFKITYPECVNQLSKTSTKVNQNVNGIKVNNEIIDSVIENE